MRLGIINGEKKTDIKIKNKNVNMEFLHCDTNENFDFIIFNKKIDFPTEKLLSGGKDKNYVFVNLDEYDTFNRFANTFLITYGMNGKSCITASSVQENKIQICIQRNLLALTGQMVEEQEFGISFPQADKLLYEIMYLSATNILYYGDTNHLAEWF